MSDRNIFDLIASEFMEAVYRHAKGADPVVGGATVPQQPPLEGERRQIHIYLKSVLPEGTTSYEAKQWVRQEVRDSRIRDFLVWIIDTQVDWTQF